MIRFLAALAAAAVAAPVHAQGSDELWEVSTQMNMAGMPAGMGGQTQRVCVDKDPRKEATSRRETSECKVTDMKESGNRFTMTMTCPQGTAVMERTYNASRTEYKGSMRMTTRDGEMTMTQSGRRLGACDAKQARGQQQEQAAAMQGQVAAMQAQAQASMKQSQDRQIADCRAAVDTMEMRKLGIYSMCHQQPQMCQQQQRADDPVGPACTASKNEYCKRYQTMDGFMKAKGDEAAAKLCALSRESVRASLCTGAVKQENLGFVGRYCPVEGKPLAQKHCAGFDFTSAPAGARRDFCSTYMANRDLESPKSGAVPAATSTQTTTQKSGGSVSESVNQGVNKLRGLFGR